MFRAAASLWPPGGHLGHDVAVSDEKKPPLPRWWTSGNGPLAIGVAASLAAALIALLRARTPPDGFGTLILISLIANVAAFDNATDQRGRRDTFRGGAAIAASIIAVIAGAVIYGARS